MAVGEHAKDMHLKNAFMLLAIIFLIVGFNTTEDCIVCKPGQQKKDVITDCYTPCESCQLGYFSTEGHTERCRPLPKKTCEEDLNKITVHGGNATQSRVCGPCLEGFTKDLALGRCFRSLKDISPAPNTNSDDGDYSWRHTAVGIGIGILAALVVIVGAITTSILLKRRKNIPPQRPEDVALREDVNNDIHREGYDVNVQIVNEAQREEMNNIPEGEAENELEEEVEEAEIEQNRRFLPEGNEGAERREDDIDADDRPLAQRVAGVQPQEIIGRDEGIPIEQLRINNERQREFVLDD